MHGKDKLLLQLLQATLPPKTKPERDQWQELQKAPMQKEG
jgi:hypothetical protein